MGEKQENITYTRKKSGIYCRRIDIDLRQLLCDLPGSSQYAVPPVPENRLFLDAICLALFNNMPRTTGIEGTKMPDVGQEFIQQGDRRQILLQRILPKRWLL